MFLYLSLNSNDDDKKINFVGHFATLPVGTTAGYHHIPRPYGGTLFLEVDVPPKQFCIIYLLVGGSIRPKTPQWANSLRRENRAPDQ